ncbi:glycosyltransferase family 2 protein [Paenibacillus odorifer]|uniref:glycosyltransferase family 2 protein n=1 Tax=Paenibacillus odorifer TaxID=189426 RepID=UPI000BA1571F|nr:glycosyltransferase family 2 protein [Paenibacillus odorifer]OZQ71155.1 hypothetical protein CA596_22895 [Paenibacillus odorifer]
MNTICIVLLNYNGTNDTIECIESIENLNSNDVDFKIIIVDNNSEYNEIFQLESYLKEKHNINSEFVKDNKYFLIKNNINLGFSAGNNKGIKFAEEHFQIDYYLLLNNDTLLENNSITELLTAFNESDVGAASGLIIEHSTKNRIWYAGGHISNIRSKGIHHNYGKNYKNLKLKEKDTKFLSGCYVIFKREALLNIQLLNERYFFGTEEYDYSLKLRKYGYKLKFIPTSIIYHKVKIMDGNGSSHNIHDLIYIYNSMRNKYILKWSNSYYINAKIWSLFWSFYIKYVLFNRIQRRYGNTEYEKKMIRKVYHYYKLNLNKKFVDHTEFNCVKANLNSLE